MHMAGELQDRWQECRETNFNGAMIRHIGQRDLIHHQAVDHLHHQMGGMPSMQDLWRRKDFDFNENTYRPLLTPTMETPPTSVQSRSSIALKKSDNFNMESKKDFRSNNNSS